jgi:cohesin complex subunit SCC1
LDLAGATRASELPNPGLNMPDLLADPLEIPALDESLFNTQAMDLDFGGKNNDPLNWSSQAFFDPLSTERPRNAPAELPELYEDDLEIDIDGGASIERGRDAMPNLSAMGDDLLQEGKLFDDDLSLDLGLGDDGNLADAMDVENPDHFTNNIDDTLVGGDRERRESALSEVRSEDLQGLDDTTMSNKPARQPAKKRKVLQMDYETMLPHSTIKSQQENRSAILKPMSFLPKDPVLLALMDMQKNGTLVSSLMGDGRAKGWAPELRGILSIEVVRKSGALKRKRDGAPDEMDEDMPQIEIPDDGIVVDDNFGDLTQEDPSTMIHLPADEQNDARDPFDETTAPLVHPDDQGPISQGTQHAVHLLRERFGGSEEASTQAKANVLFQDLLPEANTSRMEATKMFFETLVLATKDAVKVEQAEGKLGAPIRIRAKRGLWGAWAEREAGGEIEQEEQQSVPVAA